MNTLMNWTGTVVTLVLLLCDVVPARGATAETPSAESANAVVIPQGREIIARLKKEHPRLIATAADFTRLKGAVREDPVQAEWLKRIVKEGREILKAAPSKYEIPDGLRLLNTSRRVLSRIQTLGLLHRLTGQREYSERAWKELEAAAQFQDWNPRHFLDTAEMTHAFAIGYDWFYDVWTPEQRKVLREAMVEKGLKLALESHHGRTRYGGWVKARHNWNQVCNGGIGMGALAIGDEVPELAGDLLQLGLQSIQLPMREFAPDGAWNEGPGYWNYATTYNMVILAALQTALGTDYGLSGIPGFAESGMFPIYATGPSGKTFNYADAGEGSIRAPHMFWMARQFKRPAYAAYQKAMASPDPLDIVWYEAPPPQAALNRLPFDKYFRRAEVATFRSAWDDPRALFAGFKAGDNKANHSNLDLGTFVLEAQGVRWAVDLGADNYNLPGYFGAQRWNYYRLRPEGHNTLVINPGLEPGQDPKAATQIVRFDSKPRAAFAIADLTPAYARHATSVQRGIAMLDRSHLVVLDEVHTPAPASVWWFLHTPGKGDISADGQSVILEQGGARLFVKVVKPAQARLQWMPAIPMETSPQAANQRKNGVQKLAINLQGIKDLELGVVMVPMVEGQTGTPRVPDVVPLARW